MAAPARLIREVLTSAIASLPAARQRRPIVIVLGLDGSGTSLCSRALSALGVEMTDKAASPKSQPTKRNGAAEHWERPEIAGFHNRMTSGFAFGDMFSKLFGEKDVVGHGQIGLQYSLPEG